MGISGEMMRPAVFLDRDGVISRPTLREGKPYPPHSLAELELLPGVQEALRALKAGGYCLVVVTNQPDIARGTALRTVVDSMNDWLKSILPLDAVLTCPHDDDDQCQCRKPLPGLITQAARELHVECTASYMIGDRWRDVEAGRRAGCKTFYIDRGYDEPAPETYDFRVRSLPDAARIILQSNTSVTAIRGLKVKIFADGADAPEMLEMYSKPYIKGLTTNPTLMRKAGISNYRAFAWEILAQIRDKPLSFEVVCDEFAEMERQAFEISGWADNVYVKIPVTNTRGEPSYALIRRLASRGVKLNVTAIMTLAQVREVVSALSPEVASFVSVFAGRIADTGVDPVPLMADAVQLLKTRSKAELIWASPREVLNIFHADSIGCHVVTATRDILKKLPLVGYNLDEYSLDTVRMFYRDAVAAGFSPCQ